jgi:hypothetical protein
MLVLELSLPTQLSAVAQPCSECAFWDAWRAAFWKLTTVCLNKGNQQPHLLIERASHNLVCHEAVPALPQALQFLLGA